MSYAIGVAEISGVQNITAKMGMYEVMFNLSVNNLQNIQKVTFGIEQTESSFRKSRIEMKFNSKVSITKFPCTFCHKKCLTHK